jgi:hypothetical protein
VGTSNKKETKDEAKSSSEGLSRAQKAEEKHRRRVTLAQGGKGRGIVDSNNMKNSEHRLHRRSSISRAQSLAYIAKTRTARSSTQGFSNVEGDEVKTLTFLNLYASFRLYFVSFKIQAMAMADAIMGAIGTSKGEEEGEEEDEEEETDRASMMSQWQQKLENVKPKQGKLHSDSVDDEEDGDNVRTVQSSRIMPSFSHIHAGSPRAKQKLKKPMLEAFSEDEPPTLNNKLESGEVENEDRVTPRSHRSATTGDIGDDAYQKAVSNALKTTSPWGRVKSAAIDIASARKSRAASVSSGDTPTKKGISWTFIDDAMEALSPSRKTQSPRTPTLGSPVLDPNSPTSPRSPEDSSTAEDMLAYQGWLQVAFILSYTLFS